MLNFETFGLGPLSANCSLIWDDQTQDAWLVDPGEEADQVQARLQAKKLTLKGILLTHGHFDHVGAAFQLQREWNCSTYLHSGDFALLENINVQTQLYGMPAVQKPEVQPLEDGQSFFGLTVIHTPGHSPGGCCFLGEFANGKVLFAGDTLFQGGVGRSDLMGGSWETLEKSIRERLYVLPDETHVIPGHGPATRIGFEAQHNGFVRRR